MAKFTTKIINKFMHTKESDLYIQHENPQRTPEKKQNNSIIKWLTGTFNKILLGIVLSQLYTFHTHGNFNETPKSTDIFNSQLDDDVIKTLACTSDLYQQTCETPFIGNHWLSMQCETLKNVAKSIHQHGDFNEFDSIIIAQNLLLATIGEGAPIKIKYDKLWLEALLKEKTSTINFTCINEKFEAMIDMNGCTQPDEDENGNMEDNDILYPNKNVFRDSI